MTPAELLAELERLNINLTLAGDKLRVEAPAGTLTDELKGAVARYKQAIVREMQKRRDGYRQKVIPFPYPISETLGIGDFDPLDIRYINGKSVLDPGWWKKIPRRKKRY